MHEAIQFVIDEVEQPAMEHPLLEKAFKDKVIRSRTIVRNTKKIGDLHRYLKRFEEVPEINSDKRDLYNRFKFLGLKTYEDLYPEFLAKYQNQLDDVTVLDDFIIGRQYSSWDISIYSQTYDTQSGIYLIGDEPNYQAIFIKATFENGKYPNQWINAYDVLKYYLYSVKDVFKPEYKYNAAIINSNQTNAPIYVFSKDGTILTLKGIYRYDNHYEHETDGSKWFILNKVESLSIRKTLTISEYVDATTKLVDRLKGGSRSERLNRLQIAPKKPDTVTVVSTAYKRNPDVIIEVLNRANGVCEDCKKPSPFLRKNDLTPYLEVHHVIPLAEGGDDTVENAKALCPNCHRQAHHGANVQTVVAALLVEDGKILIAKRGRQGELSGKWEFAGGKMETGETPEQCLRREIKEELGVIIKVGRYFGESAYTYEDGIIRLMVYKAKRIAGEIVPTEHKEIRWVTKEQLVDFDFLPADVPIVEMIMKSKPRRQQ
ncbi:NUDIX domain-containing protein [Brevibacillus choshinensis]|uniref:NUDIX domain-containing protein n=1 Tax=Brevibacillus choshinensis TaxID=54911 RepID=UPI002E2285D8|nr:NUDIX domain-containing protein [Brevibacillus choshinensis]MED4780953.1 NUDIX domain-containing protein [Brevibacillus choshinensis]